MSNIEAIIVDGVRYIKVKVEYDCVCGQCELLELCRSGKLEFDCHKITYFDECWKRKE